MEIKIIVDEKAITAIEALAYALANVASEQSNFVPQAVQQPTSAVQLGPQTPASQQLPFVQAATAQKPPLLTPVQLTPTVQSQSVPVAQPVPQPVAGAVPTATPTYTMEQLAVAGTQLVDAGRRDDLVKLLAAFGVQSLTELPEEQYGAFATKLRELEAKI